MEGNEMFFLAKEQPTLDTYDQMNEIVQALLLFECPNHRSQHHILFTANIKLAHLNDARQHYRKLIDPATPVGRYARTAYETLTQHYHALNTLINGYMLLCDEAERNRYNHNFLFSKEKIEDCYILLKNYKIYEDILPIDNDFWITIQQQILPILSELQ